MESNQMMKQENQELRIAKNLLIDKVEEQDSEIQKKDTQIADLQEEMLQLKKQTQQYEQKQKKLDKKEKRKLLRESCNRFFDRIESVLYRCWMGAWIAVIGLLMTGFVTVMLNAELRNFFLEVLKNSVLGG